MRAPVAVSTLVEGFIGVCIDLLYDVDLARAAYRVNAMAFAIVEDIVGIAGDVDLCNDIARIGVEHDKPGGKPAADKQSMIRFVERHREISKGQICFPSCNDFAFVAIDYRPRDANWEH